MDYLQPKREEDGEKKQGGINFLTHMFSLLWRGRRGRGGEAERRQCDLDKQI